jgi:hypothetical protein
MRRQHRGTTGARSGRTAAGAVFHPSVTGAHRLRHIPARRLVCATIALAAQAAVAATFPIDLHPDWGDMNITAETGTIEGSRPLTYVMLSSQDSRKARCRVTFDMRALRPEVFHRQLAPGKTLRIHYGPMRVVNRMSIAVHCTPMYTITKPAPETD